MQKVRSLWDRGSTRGEELGKMWRSLPDAVKTGKPVMEVNTDVGAQEIFPKLAEAIFPNSYATAKQVATLLKRR